MSGEIRNNELLFPIVFGTTKEVITKRTHTTTIISYLPEVGVIDNLPKNKIKCIIVPENKVNFIKKMINMTNTNMLVLAANSNEKRFYNIDIEDGRIYINEERYNDFKNRRKEKEIELQGIKEAVQNRKLSIIKKIIKRLNNNIIRGVEEKNESKRTK